MTAGEFAAACVGATATAASPLLGAVDADGSFVVAAGGISMWVATMAKSWLDHRERMAKFEADVADLRIEARRISALAREMAEVIRVDREWMREAATKAGMPLPKGFGQRSFDQPSTDVNPIINLGSDDDLTPPRSQDVPAPGK